MNEVVPSLCLSCSGHVSMRMLLQINTGLRDPTDAVPLLSRSCFGHCLCLFSFRSPFVRSSCCRSVLVSVSRFEMRILDFLLEMSLDHQHQSAIIILLVAECRLYAIGRSLGDCRPTLCRRPERRRSAIGLCDKSLKSKKMASLSPLILKKS